MKYEIKDDTLKINVEEEDVKEFFKERKFNILSGMTFKDNLVAAG